MMIFGVCFVLSLFSTWRLYSREAKTRIRQSDWLKLAGEKIRREQVGSVPTFLSVRANKVAKWKIGFIFDKLSARKEFCSSMLMRDTIFHKHKITH